MPPQSRTYTQPWEKARHRWISGHLFYMEKTSSNRIETKLIFVRDDAFSLDEEINNFLKENENDQVLDIQYQAIKGENGYNIHSALIIYIPAKQYEAKVTNI